MLVQAKLNRDIFFWILYQFALGMLLSPFVICFPLYVSHYLVAPGQDPKAILFIIWGLSNVFSTLVTPYFGMYLDVKHTHRFWLIIMTMAIVILFPLLHQVFPSSHYLLDYIIIIVMLNMVGACLRILLNTVMLDIIPEQSMGKISHFGFAGVVLGAILGLMYSSLGSGVEAHFEHVTLYFPFWFFLFTIGLIVVYRHQPHDSLSSDRLLNKSNLLTLGILSLYRHYPETLKLIVAKGLLFGGFLGLIIVFPFYIHHKFHFTEQQIVELYFIATIFFFISSLLFGIVARWFNEKILLFFVIFIAWLISIAIILCDSRDWFIVLFCLLSWLVSPMLSLMRSLFLNYIPASVMGVAFGSGDTIAKLLYLLGPASYFIIKSLTPYNGLALLSTFVTTPLGLILLLYCKNHADQAIS